MTLCNLPPNTFACLLVRILHALYICFLTVHMVRKTDNCQSTTEADPVSDIATRIYELQPMAQVAALPIHLPNKDLIVAQNRITEVSI